MSPLNVKGVLPSMSLWTTYFILLLKQNIKINKPKKIFVSEQRFQNRPFLPKKLDWLGLVIHRFAASLLRSRCLVLSRNALSPCCVTRINNGREGDYLVTGLRKFTYPVKILGLNSFSFSFLCF